MLDWVVPCVSLKLKFKFILIWSNKENIWNLIHCDNKIWNVKTWQLKLKRNHSSWRFLFFSSVLNFKNFKNLIYDQQNHKVLKMFSPRKDKLNVCWRNSQGTLQLYKIIFYLDVNPSDESVSTLIRFMSSEFISFSCNLVCIISLPDVHPRTQFFLCLHRLRNDANLSMINELVWWLRMWMNATYCTLHNLPLYQYIVPKSCGPCCSLHVNVISLPDFMYRSIGPSIRAFSSTEEK